MEKKKNTPKLRFPEFKGEWEEKKLGEVNVEVIDGDRGKKYPNDNDFFNEGYCMFLNAKNVTKDGFLFENNTFISKEKDDELRKGKLQRHDIVLTTRGSIGNIAYYNDLIIFDNLRINSGMVLIRSYGNVVLPNYLYKFLNSDFVKKEIKKISFGSAQPQLTVALINKIQVAYPSLSEQTKIATFLTAVDEKLTQLKKKKILLEQYKKGVMQKLFSQELRFKDDNNQDFPDWQEKTLGEISKITNGNGDVQDASLEAKDGWYPFYDRSEIVKYLDRYTFDGEAIIYPGEGQSFFPRYFNGKYGLHQRCYTIKDYCANIHGKYLYYYLSTQNNYFIAFAVGSTVPSLRLDTFQQAKVLLPSLVEQQKIATFLSAIDEKISHSSAQIEKMEAWKKGLLQQMFC